VARPFDRAGTEVCPEPIKITDNGIILLKVASRVGTI
jgi:hypothetical protein